MRSVLLPALLGISLVNAHPAPGSPSGLRKRTVDLDAYRLKATADYTSSEAAKADASVLLLKKRATPVETATELLKSKVPGASFRVTDSYVSDTGISHVYFKQTAHGLDIDNADFNVNVATDGSILSFGNNFFNGEIPAENPLKKRDFSGPIDALQGATATLQLGVTGEASAEAIEGVEAYTLKGTSGAEKDPEARLVYFVKPDSTLGLTWRVETDIMDNWLLSYVDAANTAEVHGVVDYVAEAATYQVYPWGLNDPTEGSRQIISDPWDAKASEFTWLSDGSSNYTTTRGNNGIAQTNPSGGTAYLNNYRPTSSSLSFQYPYTTASTPPTSYVDASVTQLFYTANTYHDLLHTLGFTEAAGNFETNNNGAGGQGNDMVVLMAQDGSGTNNANFATPPDGQMPRMRMYIWNKSTPNRDCSFEAGVVIHEYTHGLSNRLTGGPSTSSCLSATESGGMGEGWGDFMATAIRLKASDTRATNYPMGAWVNNNAAGIRVVLYSTSLTTNPDTYKTVDGQTAVHRIGTTWASMLYEVLWNLIDKHGKNDGPTPVLVNGVPQDGKYLAMKLVLEGMKLQPCNPNFVQARSAIIDADKALTGGANACALWTAFAKRGLGSGAAYGTTRTASTTIPSGVC